MKSFYALFGVDHFRCVAFLIPAIGKPCVLCALVSSLALHMHGTVLAHGDLHGRIETLTRYIAAEPNNGALYMQRGELHRHHQDFEAALADYAKAEQLDTNLLTIDMNRGKALWAAGRHQAAKQALERFIKRFPDHAEALLTRARVLVALNDLDGAVSDFNRALKTHPDPTPDLYLERAQAMKKPDNQNVDEILRGLDEGLKRLGPAVTLQLIAIDFELQARRYDAALERVHKLTEQMPRKDLWLARRAEILVQAGRPKEAAKAYKEALAALEKLPESRRYAKATMDFERQLRTELERLSTKDH